MKAMTLPQHDHRQHLNAIARGLEQAERLREFVTDAAGTEHGAGHGVFGDLAAIDDMVSDLERVRDRLKREPDRPLLSDRAEAVATSLARLDLWTDAVARGTARAGELQRLEVRERRAGALPHRPDGTA